MFHNFSFLKVNSSLLRSIVQEIIEISERILNTRVLSNVLEGLVFLHAKEVSEVIQSANLPITYVSISCC